MKVDIYTCSLSARGSAGDCPVSKKARSADVDIADGLVRWELEGDNRKWVELTSEQNKLLTGAWSKNKDEASSSKAMLEINYCLWIFCLNHELSFVTYIAVIFFLSSSRNDCISCENQFCFTFLLYLVADISMFCPYLFIENYLFKTFIIVS